MRNKGKQSVTHSSLSHSLTHPLTHSLTHFTIPRRFTELPSYARYLGIISEHFIFVKMNKQKINNKHREGILHL